MKKRKMLIKNQPPMRKWVIGLLIFYFLCIMRIYGTPKEFSNIEFIGYMLKMLQKSIIQTIKSDPEFSLFSFILFGVVLIGCILDREFKYMFVERLVEIKKEFTGELENEEWADRKKLVRRQIFICQELREYAEIIYNLCKKAGIYEVNFIREDANKLIISTSERSGQPPAIIVSIELLSRLERIEPAIIRLKIFKFIIAHELIHVKYHDDINKIWMWRFYGLLWVGGLAIVWNYFLIYVTKGMLYKIISVTALLAWIIFASILISPSYWWQVVEFRADRIGLKISEESPLVFETYAKYFPDGIFGKKSLLERILNYLKILGLFFLPKMKRDDEVSHPSNNKRKEELNRGRNWNMFEYFRYGYQMKKISLMGKGKQM